MLIIIVSKFWGKTQLLMIQSIAGHFDPEVFVNCVQGEDSCMQLTKTSGLKQPAFETDQFCKSFAIY